MFRQFPHLGLYVADLDRATRFYVEGLGFERSHEGRGEGLEKFLGLDNANTKIQFVRHPEGMTIELWTLENGNSIGDGRPDAINSRGVSHFCMMVDNLEEAAARIVEFGGYRLDATRIEHQYGPLMFCADPDGVRIELIEIRPPSA